MKTFYKNKLELVLSIMGIISMIIIGLFVFQFFDTFSNLSNSPKQNVRYESNSFSSQEFEFRWVQDVETDLRLGRLGAIKMISMNNTAYMLLHSGIVTKIDMVSGEMEDTRPPRDISLAQIASTIASNSRFMIIGFDGTQKIQGTTEWGAGKIVAYDLATGNQEWSRIIPGAQGIETLIADEEYIIVNATSSSNYYILNTHTGEILETLPKNISNFTWAIKPTITYERWQSSDFVAISSEQEQELWRTDILGVFQPPFFLDDKIIARTGNAAQLGDMIALNITDGSILWSYNGINSNITISDSVGFFVSKEGRLIALDINNGEVLGSLKFQPAPFDNPLNDVFHVTSNDNLILVHTGDGKQLLGFEFNVVD